MKDEVLSRAERAEAACELALATICAVLEREPPPPSGWEATEYRSKDGLSVALIVKADPDEHVPKEAIGKWRIDSPRDPERGTYETAEAAMLHAGELERWVDELRA